MWSRSRQAAEGVDTLNDSLKSLDSTLEQWIRTRRAAQLGLTPEELLVSESVTGAETALEDAQQRLEAFQKALEELQGGYTAGVMFDGEFILDPVRELARLEAELAAARERAATLSEKLAEEQRVAYEALLVPLEQEIALLGIRARFGEDSLQLRAEEYAQAMANHDADIRAQVQSRELSAEQGDELIALNSERAEGVFLLENQLALEEGIVASQSVGATLLANIVARLREGVDAHNEQRMAAEARIAQYEQEIALSQAILAYGEESAQAEAIRRDQALAAVEAYIQQNAALFEGSEAGQELAQRLRDAAAAAYDTSRAAGQVNFNGAISSIDAMNARLDTTLSKIGGILSAIGRIGFDIVATRAETAALQAGATRAEAAIEGQYAADIAGGPQTGLAGLANRLGAGAIRIARQELLAAEEQAEATAAAVASVGSAGSAAGGAVAAMAVSLESLVAEMEKEILLEREMLLLTGAARREREIQIDLQNQLSAANIAYAEDAIAQAAAQLAAEEDINRGIEERREAMERLADDLGSEFASFFESGFTDFQGFVDGVLGIFQKMLVDMVAQAAATQIKLALNIGTTGGATGGGFSSILGGLGSMGGATASAGGAGASLSAMTGTAAATGTMAGLGGAISALAGPAAIAIGLFSILRARQQRRNQEEKKESDERYRLETRLLELQGRTRALREREIAALQPGNRALGRRIQRLEEEARIAAQRDTLESQLLELQGNTAEIRRRELMALDESNRALQEHIWMLEDQAIAAAEAAAVQQERMTLEQQRLTLLGREDLLREQQLAALDESNQALQEEIWALEDAAAAAEEAARIADERAGLERQLLELQGDTAALRALELEQLDESNRALQEQIWALEDQAAAAEKATAAAEEAARAAENAANERLALERQLLELQGNTAELRRRELETLDPTNRALQQQIWLMEDMQAVAQEREGLERRLLELQGDTAALRAMDLAALDASNRALQEQIWALEDMQRALDDLDMNDFMSLIDYNRAVAQANAGIMGLTANTNGVPSAPSISTVPMPPVTSASPSTTSGSASSTMTDVQVRDAIKNLTDITQQLLTRVDNNTRRTRDILTIWDEDGLPEERVA
jgi:hypothetical protein